MKTELDLLAFSPHPDDAELFCGGLLALSCSRGLQVGLIDLTRGELSSQGDPETRARESQSSSETLGLAFRKNLELPDGGISAAGSSESHNGSSGETGDGPARSQLETVVRALREARPAMVVVPYWRDRHPDHSAASELVTRAVFFAGVKHFAPNSSLKPFVPMQVLYYQLRTAFKPSFVVDIAAVRDTKMAAIRCFQSQIVREPGAPAGEPGSPGTLVSSPLSVDSIAARDSYYGAMIGVSAGEPYLIKTPLSIPDPVSFFRNNSTAAALIFPEST